MSEAAHSVQPQLASWLQLVVKASAPTTYGAKLSEEGKTIQQAWGKEGRVSPEAPGAAWGAWAPERPLSQASLTSPEGPAGPEG